MNELDKLLIHFRPPNKFNFFSNYKKKHNNKEQGKQILSCRLFGVLCCSLEKALTRVKNLPHFFKTQSSKGQEIGGREIGISRPYKKRIGG
jgi:hypothetical protein